MKNTAYDLMDLGSLQRWQKTLGGDNRERLDRLARYLPVAIAEELTPRQQQLLHMFYYDGKSVSTIARELSVNKSTVTRTLQPTVTPVSASGWVLASTGMRVPSLSTYIFGFGSV